MRFSTETASGFILTPLLLLYPHDSPQTLTAISLGAVSFNAASGGLGLRTAAADRLPKRRRLRPRDVAPVAIAGALVVGLVSQRVFGTIMGLVLAMLAGWLLEGERVRLQLPPDRPQAVGTDRRRPPAHVWPRHR